MQLNGCVATISVTIDETPSIAILTQLHLSYCRTNQMVRFTNVSGGTPCYNGAAGSLSGGGTGTLNGVLLLFDLEA